MSKDLTFKENMELSKISGLPSFGAFCAKWDTNELFIDEEKVKITNPLEKLKLFEKIIKDHIEIGYTNFNGANCVDVAEFLLDYLNEMKLFGENNLTGILDLKETLEEIKDNNGTLGARETFEFVLNYSKQIGLIKDTIDISR